MLKQQKQNDVEAERKRKAEQREELQRRREEQRRESEVRRMEKRSEENMANSMRLEGEGKENYGHGNDGLSSEVPNYAKDEL